MSPVTWEPSNDLLSEKPQAAIFAHITLRSKSSMNDTTSGFKYRSLTTIQSERQKPEFYSNVAIIHDLDHNSSYTRPLVEHSMRLWHFFQCP